MPIQDEPDDEELGPLPDPELTGVIYGQTLLTLVDESNSLSDRSTLREWQEAGPGRRCRGVVRRCPAPSSSPSMPSAFASPAGAGFPLHWDGNRNYLGIDLDPGPNGVVGQVINFGGDERRKYVLATSWGRFLEDFADELEAGNFVLDAKHKFGSFLFEEAP